MLTASDSAMSCSLISSSATVVTGGGGGGFRLVLDFDFVPVPDFSETAPTTKEDTGILTVKDDEDSWLKAKSEGFAELKRYCFEVNTRNGD